MAYSEVNTQNVKLSREKEPESPLEVIQSNLIRIPRNLLRKKVYSAQFYPFLPKAERFDSITEIYNPDRVDLVIDTLRKLGSRDIAKNLVVIADDSFLRNKEEIDRGSITPYEKAPKIGDIMFLFETYAKSRGINLDFSFKQISQDDFFRLSSC